MKKVLALGLSLLCSPAFAQTVGPSIGAVGSAVVGQLPGTATNDNAAAGKVGEVISSTVLSSSPVSLAVSSTYYNLTSITLTPGDWDLTGWLEIDGAGGTNFTGVLGSLSTTSGNYGAEGSGVLNFFSAVAAAGYAFTLPTLRVSTAVSVTYYLVGRANWTVSAPVAYGNIRARRAR